MAAALTPPPTQLLLVGSAPRQAALLNQLRAGGSHWSSVVPEVLPTLEAALNFARSQPPHAVLPLLLIADDAADQPALQSVLLPASLNDDLASRAQLAPVILLPATHGHAESYLTPSVAEAIHQARLLPVRLQPTDAAQTLRQLAEQLDAAAALATLRLAHQHASQQWELAENRFRDMADQFTDWLWEIDTSLHLTFSSSRKRPAQGATRGALFTSSFLTEERLRIEDDFAELMRTPRAFHDRDYWSADPYGTRVCWSLSGTPIYQPGVVGNGDGGALLGFRGVARDVSPMKIATDQLYFLANNDPLTGVANRQRFTDELARTLRLAARENRTGALVLLDLDRFGLINQTHGPAVGDRALIHFAQILKDHIRTGDLLARLDGDQFGLLLRDVRPTDLPARLERLQATLAARALPLTAGSVTLSTSGGIAFYPEHAVPPDAPVHGGLVLSPEDLHAHAQDALSAAQQHGANRLETYNPAAPAFAGAGQRLAWIEFINACLAAPEERITLHFQPIMPLGQSIGEEFYEVLVRLRDDSGNPIPAQQYIGIVEEVGRITALDTLVLQRALSLQQAWLSAGRRVRLSVNLSAHSVDDPAFLPLVLAQLKAAALPQGLVVFELTETALLRDLATAKTFIQQVRQAGATFALDDCGVGYSSLNYLRELDLDYLKIDGTFIRQLHTNPDDQAVVKALVAIARQKGIATIAEMVEHTAALEIARALEIDFGQGFYIAPPAAEAVTPVLGAPTPTAPTRW